MRKYKSWFSEWYRDIFREASNIAISHALTALSNMIGEIEMEPPEVEVIPRTKFLATLAAEGISNSFVVMFDITEGLSGLTILQFPKKSAQALVSLLLGMAPSDDGIDDMGRSAIMEIGNILISVYTDILAKLIEEPVSLSPPKQAESPYDVERELARPDLRDVLEVIIFRTRFYQSSTGVESLFYLVPTKDAFDKLVGRLEAQVKDIEPVSQSDEGTGPKLDSSVPPVNSSTLKENEPGEG
ncbi:chemotaxis protein cheC [Thermococcus onnurineus NA1]|uniref:Chemotaxis protein cheC n=1 Tax=Thermococcus onnurineus (strain NA1) TaxID=523850 RepID=B6YX75_THEON|nr:MULTISPECIES: chemotaxis protein CheC [Thermococcus]ACJ16688.1 chemotaxis protein cheC [Thermococcus onnurineus NA1]NJE47529.1 chemotaxis protein CheC [Thermococcus sp. GR7]NJE78543.1 chemotaxis protein CheC [Thermococcus sp. GR4]NJF24010.1 chemotaxis protein CheC [Thermococcus sp. GR5]